MITSTSRIWDRTAERRQGLSRFLHQAFEGASSPSLGVRASILRLPFVGCSGRRLRLSEKGTRLPPIVGLVTITEPCGSHFQAR